VRGRDSDERWRSAGQLGIEIMHEGFHFDADIRWGFKRDKVVRKLRVVGGWAREQGFVTVKVGAC